MLVALRCGHSRARHAQLYLSLWVPPRLEVFGPLQLGFEVFVFVGSPEDGIFLFLIFFLRDFHLIG